jgi:outer membrane protein
MRFLTTVCAAALLAPTLASANELDRLYGLALENDTVLRAAVGARDAALEARPITRGALLPQVGANGSYGFQDSQQTVGGKAQPPSNEKSTSYGASVSQALFDGGAWFRWRQAGDTVALAQVRYRSAEQSLVLRTAEAYFNLLAAADTVRLADAQKQSLSQQLELANKRFEVGLSAITDTQETQARYDLALAQMIAAEQALVTARIAMENLSGAQDVRVVPLKDEIPLVGPAPVTPATWRQAAAEGNLDVKAAEIVAQSADKDIDIANAAHWPVLSASGQYNNTSGGGFVSKSETTQYGVGVQVPIFAGGSTQARVNSAKSTHQQRVAELEGARRAADSNTLIAFQNVLSSVAQIKAQKQAVLSNTTALEASSVGVEVGSRTTVDVLNAQSVLFSAQQTYARSRYDYLLNLLRLKALTGSLMQKDLLEIDALLGPGPVAK